MTTPIYWFVYGSLFRIADATVKATFLLALVAAAVLLLRRSSASVRHLVWALGLGAALVLPLSSWVPHWRVPYTVPPTHSRPLPQEVPPVQTPQPMPKATAPSPQAMVGAVPATAPQEAEGPPAAPPPVSVLAPVSRPADTTSTPVPWTAWVLLVWAVGVVFVLAQLAQGLLLVRRLARASVPITTGPLADAARAAANTMGLRRPVALRLAASAGQVSVPLTYGAWRPVVVLPADAPAWPAARIGAALLHEMAHVRRHDWALQVMAHAVRAAYWFDPLVWLAARRLRAEAEAACDDLVLGAGLSAPDYARHLLDVALGARRSQGAGWGAVAMAQSPKVEGRLRAVLAQHSRRPVTRKAAAGLLAAALLLALPLGALRLVAQGQAIPDALRLVAQGQAVPDADRLKLSGDFTLRYAVTITDQTTVAEQFRYYQQLRAGYTRRIRKDPYLQPDSPEFYAPFSYFRSQRPKTRHVVITVSSQANRLFYQTVEGGDTYAQIYDGHNTQAFRPGYAGPINPGRQIVMNECPLPAVGLPFLPLLKNTARVSSAGMRETWQSAIVEDGVVQGQNEPYYTGGLVHAVRNAGEWKLLNTDNIDQRWQFLQHQRFQHLWIASRMRLIKYDTDAPLPPKGKYRTIQAWMAWFKTVRKPSEFSEYRLLSASQVPYDLRALLKPLPRNRPSAPPDMDSLVREALHLRYHLQDWALTHKALLQQMAQGAQAAPQVDASLRALPFPLWAGDPRPNHIWDGDPRIAHNGPKPLFTAERLGPSGGAGDFAQARSRNSGPVHIILWASGRITRGGREIVPAFYREDGAANMAGDGLPESQKP